MFILPVLRNQLPVQNLEFGFIPVKIMTIVTKKRSRQPVISIQNYEM